MWKRMLHGEVKFSVADGGVNMINRFRKFSLRSVKNVEIGGMPFLEFTIPRNHKREVTRLLGKREFTATENRNTIRLFHFFRTRLALVAMAILCISTFFVTEQYAFRVELSGITGDEYTAVSNYLSQNGINLTDREKTFFPLNIVPKSFSKNPTTAENLIREFPFIAHANLSVRGSTLVVTVQRADFVTFNTGDIIASIDGVIADITVFSGTQNVFVGDLVHAGDPLVTGDRPTAIIKITNGTETISTYNNVPITQKII